VWNHAAQQLAKGRNTFRFDTFGDEDFWGGALGLHKTIAGEKNGGIGPGLSPKVALELGLKVDSRALPGSLVGQLRAGKVNLDDPAVTLALLKLNAVVGVRVFTSRQGTVESVGITCAFCHSTVDNSLAPGIGARLDGWANRDLNVGEIIAFAPSVAPFAEILGVDEAAVRKVLRTWGPGKFDAELLLDGKTARPDGGPAATLIPPAFGMAGVNLHTWTGWGSVTHWNAFVAVLEMQGKGTLYDPRLDDASKFPLAAKNNFGHKTSDPDLVTPKLAALHFYQLAIDAPKPPRGSFDPRAAERGDELFEGKAKCATCHVPPLYTEPGWNLHKPEEIGIDAFQAQRGPEDGYRTSPLRGLWTHTTGGFYHDGRFPTLRAVVDHYDELFNLGLTDGEKHALSEYLKSL
jgi:mono/diheme cytochrome c family protein